jgi:hypothetical protein
MRFGLPMFLAVLAAVLGACQTTDTGGPARRAPSAYERDTMAPPSSPARPEVEHGDVYKEQYLDRYDTTERE